MDAIALIPFALITTFTPGPNNILAASVGLRSGYRKALPLLLGIAMGFTVVFLGCSMISTALVTSPFITKVLKVIGSLYIGYLAWHTWTASFTAVPVYETEAGGFFRGLLLQVVNIKVIMYGITIYATFLSAMPKTIWYALISAFSFALLSFLSTTSWALCGHLIARYTPSARVMKGIQALLAVALALIAIDMLIS